MKCSEPIRASSKTGEATSIIAANNPKSTINLLNFFSFLRSTYTGSVSNVLQRKDHQ
jgi:hypothetical protein